MQHIISCLKRLLWPSEYFVFQKPIPDFDSDSFRISILSPFSPISPFLIAFCLISVVIFSVLKIWLILNLCSTTFGFGAIYFQTYQEYKNEIFGFVWSPDSFWFWVDRTGTTQNSWIYLFSFSVSVTTRPILHLYARTKHKIEHEVINSSAFSA